MTTLTFSVELPDELIEEVGAAGLLTNERIAAMLEAELRREKAWERFMTGAAMVRESAAIEFGHLTEEELRQVIEEEIDAMRAENDAAQALNPTQTS